MNVIFQTAQSYVENYDLDNNSWFSFAQQCTQKEFLDSQEGFYYAVKAFPRILANLASKIESSKARLLVVENLWEEHGRGDNAVFHTATYYEYLKSLGYSKEESDISHQPWVDEWVNLVLHKSYSAAQYAMYIAGIEYIYARNSLFISQLVLNYDLCCEQYHYLRHSVLDYEHAKELIAASLFIQEESGDLSNEEMMRYFSLGINEFFGVYSRMIFLSEHEAKAISEEPHAFYYSREDVSANKLFLESWCRTYAAPAKVLMICSGGENAIDILSMKQCHDLTLLDINAHQLDVARKKINHIKENGFLGSDLIVFDTGKFEKIFAFLRKSMSYEELKGVAQNDLLSLRKFDWVCSHVFSNKILEIIFTENATKYSKDSFAEHFCGVLKNQIIWYFENGSPEDSNIGSILFNTAPIDYGVTIGGNSTIDYYHGDFLSFFENFDKSFDLIDLSNISDWMPFSDMRVIVATAYERLNSGGVIFGRKLLGDYKLADLQEGLDGSTIFPFFDKTSFYTECVFIKKL